MEFTDYKVELLENKSSALAECGILEKLHSKGSPDDLLVNIGSYFLEHIFYESLLSDKNAIVTVIKQKGDIVAFVAATMDIKQSLRRIVISHPLRIVWCCFSSVLVRPSLWLPLIRAFNLKPSDFAKPTAEILMITTDLQYRGHDFGVKLLLGLNKNLQKRNISACRARIRVDNFSALKMYDKAGYREIGLVNFHGRKWKWMQCETS